MKTAQTIACSALGLGVLFAAGCQGTARNEGLYSHVYMTNFIIREGLEFPGWVDDDHTPESPFGDAPLLMRVLEASTAGARVALHVGEDRSRTWVLTTEEDGRLRLRHDHRDPDGTPHDLTDYGGLAARGGTFNRQSFPADAFTAALISEAATNVWTLEFDNDSERFIYDLTRHGRPRFRAVFDLSRPRLAED